ncbi:hypothetical protein ADEAN_000757600 [Angomonas deanei]|uniref:Uncharacterized protein n=1 Tax=Angomonas deanei TaxID=59799 RepID=A0A7G2CPF3_9TRYP|nr:hypothetical protein ADEAN_000757600 [Angomonas deanei]
MDSQPLTIAFCIVGGLVMLVFIAMCAAYAFLCTRATSGSATRKKEADTHPNTLSDKNKNTKLEDSTVCIGEVKVGFTESPSLGVPEVTADREVYYDGTPHTTATNDNNDHYRNRIRPPVSLKSFELFSDRSAMHNAIHNNNNNNNHHGDSSTEDSVVQPLMFIAL